MPKRKKKKKKLTKRKARKILKHGSVRGKRLTKKQKGLFGLIAGGRRPTRIKRRKKRKKRRKR